jgi:hypothetical protein
MLDPPAEKPKLVLAVSGEALAAQGRQQLSKPLGSGNGGDRQWKRLRGCEL